MVQATMMRPRLRPTLSRKTKYLGIAPTAERRLGKEARRGSHDLRRLVGHANFLDVLIETFDHDDPVTPPVPEAKAEAEAKEEVEELAPDNESDTSSDSDAWSDEENDDDHQLFRTESGRPVGKDVAGPVQIATSPDEDGGDYFQLSESGDAMAHLKGARHDLSASFQGAEKGEGISVVVTSSLVELMDDLGWKPSEHALEPVSEEGESDESQSPS